MASRASSDTAPPFRGEIIASLEHAFDRGSDDVPGLTAVSGVEMIPDPGQPGSELREFLGPRLRNLAPWNAI
ncbi:hypothetical protein GCM10023317_26220 [Actinopolymorpha pittospori]